MTVAAAPSTPTPIKSKGTQTVIDKRWDGLEATEGRRDAAHGLLANIQRKHLPTFNHH